MNRLANVGEVHPIGDSVGNVKVGDQTWELFVGKNGDMKVFSFIASKQIPTFESDIRPFFDHITSEYDYPADKQYLISIHALDLLLF